MSRTLSKPRRGLTRDQKRLAKLIGERAAQQADEAVTAWLLGVLGGQRIVWKSRDKQP